jgi:hypothetical protein
MAVEGERNVFKSITASLPPAHVHTITAPAHVLRRVFSERGGEEVLCVFDFQSCVLSVFDSFKKQQCVR